MKPKDFIKIVADNPKKIRESDVYRLLDEAMQVSHEYLTGIVEYLANERPDLLIEVHAVLDELTS